MIRRRLAAVAAFALVAAPLAAAQEDAPMDRTLLARFTGFALDCVHREYPNKIAHVLNDDGDVRPPRDLTPVFYGCFDWHSSVHGHWLLVRALSVDPETPRAAEIEAAFARSFTPEGVAAEVAYYKGEGRRSFERPYGLAWFLQLIAELEESPHPQAPAWRETLRPLETEIVTEVTDWLPKLVYPIRLGTHNQTAFAFGLMIDYARTVGDAALETALTEKTLAFHAGDTACPMAYEPSGEDFLSSCLMVADLMRRVQAPDAFAVWLGGFLPDLPVDGSGDWLAPGVVLDATDGKLVHLDGLNLSRAWALEGIAAGLPEGDGRRAGLLAAAEAHRHAGLTAVSDAHYAGGHWLASFATYLLTGRGLAS